MKHLKVVADGVGAGLFAALFVVFIVQVAARFLFGRPLPWTDEAAVILYVWAILWAAALVVPEREHVAFDLVWNLASPAVQKAMRGVGYLVVGGLSAWAIPACWEYARFMSREGSAVLGLPLVWVYLPFVLLLAALVCRSAFSLFRQFRKKP